MNELIRAAEIRVIADDGEQLGVMTPADAIERASSRQAVFAAASG